MDYPEQHSSTQEAPHNDEAPNEGVILIPWDRLSADALDGIVEEYVTREGTDYGDYSFSLQDKKDQVMVQIRRGQVVVIFDPMSESCQLVLKENLPQGLS